MFCGFFFILLGRGGVFTMIVDTQYTDHCTEDAMWHGAATEPY